MHHSSGLIRSVVALLLSICLITTAKALPYSGLYVFGDSLSDVGNDLIITGGALPAKNYYTDGTVTGRFTNGANYLDGLANSLGLNIAPSLAGGNNYAYGGARTDYITPGLVPLGGKSFNQQVAAFTATHAATDPNALYVVWIGANDMADAIRAAAAAAASGGNPNPIIGGAIATAMSGIGNAIGGLAGRGARHFLVPNLPDLSLTPLIGDFNNPLLDALARGASLAFNQNLANTLDLGIFSALDIRDLDIFRLLNDIVVNPAAGGYTNVSDACYTGEVDGTPLPAGNVNPPTVCGVPGQYVFWDYEHPTAAVHAQLAAIALSVVIPEPPVWSLLLIAAALALGTRRRQARL